MLITITTNTHRLPFGTICQVLKHHKNQKGWVVTSGETDLRCYVVYHAARIL